jgi:hypothetical protein
MAWRWVLVLLALMIPSIGIADAQSGFPDHFPELKYPPIAKAARVEGDVVVSFRQTPEGGTTDVMAVSGPPMLHGVAIDNVKAWRFADLSEVASEPRTVKFHFRFIPSDSGYDEDGTPVTRVELDGVGGVRVLSIRTTGLQRSGCPSAAERVLPLALMSGDFVEVHRWNEVVRVGVDGSIAWSDREGGKQERGLISKTEATGLLEKFRTPQVWGLCGDYSQAGLMDGGSNSFKMRLGGRDKSVGEYGDAAPILLGEVELAVDEAAETHRWRHGDPTSESIIGISYEDLPKPGKTKLMDAAYSGDKAAFQGALAAGDKITDVDASGWTPLMYAAGSYGNSGENELLKVGADVNARSRRGETALMAAAARGIADEDLLHAGADVNAVNDVGMTALMLLAQRGESDEIAIMLKAGADAGKKDASGRTALDYLSAANCGRPSVAKKRSAWDDGRNDWVFEMQRLERRL